MIKYPCSLINFEFATFDGVVDSFIGQKVIIKCLDNEIIGCVDCCSIASTTVKLFGDARGFLLDDIIGIFIDSFIEMPLSPSILGRQLDFFGMPLDDLPFIISVAKPPTFYQHNQTITSRNAQIVGENDWLIRSENFKIQKGQTKNLESIDTLVPLLEISNLALVIVELDYCSKITSYIKNLLGHNNLDQVSVFFQSQSQSDVAISAFTISQAANYLCDQLGFDVLILVFNNHVLEKAQSNNFYFANKLEQIASFGASSSISVINL